MGRFSMTDMGDVSLVLGMEVSRDRTKGTVTITQENCVKFLLERYEMGIATPLIRPVQENNFHWTSRRNIF